MDPSNTSIRALLLSLGLLTGGIGCSSRDDVPATAGDASNACGNAILGGCDAGTPDATPVVLPDGAGGGCGNGPVGACQPDAGADADADAARVDSGPDGAVLGCGNGPIGACDAGVDGAKG